MLELVGTKGIDEGGEIAQESHRYPKCLAKRFFVLENAVVQATWRKLYPIYSVRKGQSERKRGWTRKVPSMVHQADEAGMEGSTL